jgi:hypothetical protein
VTAISEISMGGTLRVRTALKLSKADDPQNNRFVLAVRQEGYADLLTA